MITVTKKIVFFDCYCHIVLIIGNYFFREIREYYTITYHGLFNLFLLVKSPIIMAL
jgi:hypothetical protein